MTRKSTSGGLLVVAGMVVKSWSSTQGSVATSSGEAEYYSLARGSAEALGLAAALKDLGWELFPRVMVDSSAAKAVAGRLGLGRTRHIEVRFLWLQEAVRRRRLAVEKVRGDLNPADVLTKPKACNDFVDLLEGVNIRILVQGALSPSAVAYTARLRGGVSASPYYFTYACNAAASGPSMVFSTVAQVSCCEPIHAST